MQSSCLKRPGSGWFGTVAALQRFAYLAEIFSSLKSVSFRNLVKICSFNKKIMKKMNIYEVLKGTILRTKSFKVLVIISLIVGCLFLQLQTFHHQDSRTKSQDHQNQNLVSNQIKHSKILGIPPDSDNLSIEYGPNTAPILGVGEADLYNSKLSDSQRETIKDNHDDDYMTDNNDNNSNEAVGVSNIRKVRLEDKYQDFNGEETRAITDEDQVDNEMEDSNPKKTVDNDEDEEYEDDKNDLDQSGNTLKVQPFVEEGFKIMDQFADQDSETYKALKSMFVLWNPESSKWAVQASRKYRRALEVRPQRPRDWDPEPDRDQVADRSVLVEQCGCKRNIKAHTMVSYNGQDHGEGINSNMSTCSHHSYHRGAKQKVNISSDFTTFFRSQN